MKKRLLKKSFVDQNTKYKYRKVFLSLTSLATIIIAAISTISCGMDFPGNYKRSGGEIYLITDSGSVKDKSFNESSFIGVQDFSIQKNRSYSYIQPTTTSTELLQKSYQIACDDGAKVLVLPGFHHEADGFFNQVALKNKGTLFLALDTLLDNVVMNTTKTAPLAYNSRNIVNLSYRVEQGAFLSAIYTGIYMNEQNKINGNELKVSAFGGIPIPSVCAYMNGWLQGVRYFNDHKPASFKPMKHILVGGGSTWESKVDFSGDFKSGSATMISQRLINNGAQVVLAVAGSQTADFIGAIHELGASNTYAIGVDTDQSKLYDPNYMLGSVLKGLQFSTSQVLDDFYSGKMTIPNHGPNSKEVWIKYPQIASDLTTHYTSNQYTFSNALPSVKYFDHSNLYNGHSIVDFAPSISITNDRFTNLGIQDLNNIYRGAELITSTIKPRGLTAADLPNGISKGYGDS